MIVVWCWRWAEHAQAQSMLENTQVTSTPITRIALEPFPVDPYRWHAILETQNYYQTAEVNTHTGSIDSEAPRDVLYKPTDTPAIEAAKRTLMGHVYLDWGRWAVVRDIGQYPVPGVDPPQLVPDAPGPQSSFPTCVSPTLFAAQADRLAQLLSADGSTLSTAATKQPRAWAVACRNRASAASVKLPLLGSRSNQERLITFSKHSTLRSLPSRAICVIFINRNPESGIVSRHARFVTPTRLPVFHRPVRRPVGSCGGPDHPRRGSASHKSASICVAH
jgi:hypothetical protein